LIVLMWQMETPTYNPSGLVKGFILESEMDSRRGVVASVIVTDGILKNGQNIVTPSACGKIKMLENFLGENFKFQLELVLQKQTARTLLILIKELRITAKYFSAFRILEAITQSIYLVPTHSEGRIFLIQNAWRNSLLRW